MMRAIALSVMAAGLVLGTTGCAPNATVGTGMVMSQQWFGDTGFVGHSNNVTVLPGSRVNKLSIQGDNNTVTVMDDVTIWKVEFWGKGNTISIPEYLSIRTNAVGANQIIRRPRMVTPMPRYEPLPPVYTARPAEEPTPPADTGLPPEADIADYEPPLEDR